MNLSALHQKALLLLLLLVTLAFGWILWPFYGAVFWSAVLAIVFHPLYRRLLKPLRQRPTLAALATLLLCLLIVILPLALTGAALVQEGTQLYQRLQSGQIDVGTYLQRVLGSLPGWAFRLLDFFGIADLATLQARLSAGLNQASRFLAGYALNLGQNAFQFLIGLGVMLYLLFFLLRDGAALAERIKRALPLSPEHKRYLIDKFATVIRATIKGNLVVAAVQGTLGGVIFALLGIHGALLWGVLMALLSLLPAVGAGLVWGPAAVYFLATGALWQGLALTAFGVLVIGLVDNLLRPILVGKDTQMPDYVVLVSTLGGMAIFGLNGFVIGPVIAALFIATWDLFTAARDASAR
ncbi:AI-2E family transporter [Chitiniphilus purpureus]|uniref:AI-2E family transporter n=1 Tax=Chitiniphilus purpureus TaxID=2981137 RepID=A0ABY6DKN2_9NEIS|nr:AI-2E family transporter [Chitiniphilus sp. CD1]UXY13671.1 AI-2E family transporter [Chitiniphilus sp. CD1]